MNGDRAVKLDSKLKTKQNSKKIKNHTGLKWQEVYTYYFLTLIL